MKQDIQTVTENIATAMPIMDRVDTASTDTCTTLSLCLDTTNNGMDITILELFSTDTHQLITHTESETTIRERFDGEEIPSTLASNSWVITLLILSFVFFAISYRRGAKYLRYTFESLFKINMRGNMLDETTINENQLKLSLLTITFVTEGIAIYYTWIDKIVTNSKHILPAIALCITICALYYLAQRLVYNILGNIFSDKQQTQLFDDSFTKINLFIGLFLTPFILLMIFVPGVVPVASIICLIIFILSRLIIIYKGIIIFSLQIFGLLYLILYLCALEITPLLLLKRLVISVYNIF